MLLKTRKSRPNCSTNLYSSDLKSDYCKLAKTSGIIAIDPGVTGTGVAFFNHSENIETHIFKPANIRHSWQLRSDYIMSKFVDYINYLDIRRAFLEQPTYFASNKGQVTAESNSLTFLAFHTGRIMQALFERGFLVTFIPVNAWKGNLSKEQVEKRIEKITGQKFISHAADAVGIGLHVIGKF